MTAINQSNKATVVFDSPAVPTLTNMIDALTDLRDSVGAPGSSTLTVVTVEDNLGTEYRAIGATSPVLIFEWDAS